MREDKKKRLQAKGWKIGTAAEFLQLSPEEEAYIELRLRLGDGLRRSRLKRRLTQEALARSMKSSQSRIAKMEAGDPSVSLDLIIKALLTLGTSNRDLGKIIASNMPRAA